MMHTVQHPRNPQLQSCTQNCSRAPFGAAGGLVYLTTIVRRGQTYYYIIIIPPLVVDTLGEVVPDRFPGTAEQMYTRGRS